MACVCATARRDTTAPLTTPAACDRVRVRVTASSLHFQVGELTADLEAKVEQFATKESQMRKNKVKMQLNLRELVEK